MTARAARGDDDDRDPRGTGTEDPSNAGGGDTSREGSTDAAIGEPSGGDLARTGRNLVMLTILAAGCLAAGTALRRRFSTAR